MATKSPNKNFENWIVDNERFIAFVDIMGFKELVRKTPHEELKSLLTGLILFTMLPWTI